jgi:bifunctional non-homologous end joining protein LigD
VTVSVDGREVRLSSLDRVLWPATGQTKADLLDYYTAVAPAMLPHLADRPVTLHRFPEGVGGPHFYQTRTPPRPPWVRATVLRYPRTGKTFEVPIVDDLPSLVWATNLTTIELHPFLAPAGEPDQPRALVFDLDPGPPAGLVEAARVALHVRALLDEVGFAAYVKTSGSLGLHVHAPLPAAAESKRLAREFAQTLAAQRPREIVAEMRRSARTGKVYVDWLQNDPTRQTVAPYSLRGRRQPSVAAPLRWEEVEQAAEETRPEILTLTPADVLVRLEQDGDLFSDLR